MLHRLLILAQVFMLVVQPRICTCAADVDCAVCQRACESDCDGCCDDDCTASEERQTVGPSHDHKEHTPTCLALAPRIELKQAEAGTTVNPPDDLAAPICSFDFEVHSDRGTILVEESPPRPAIPLFLRLCTILV